MKKLLFVFTLLISIFSGISTASGEYAVPELCAIVLSTSSMVHLSEAKNEITRAEQIKTLCDEINVTNYIIAIVQGYAALLALLIVGVTRQSSKGVKKFERRMIRLKGRVLSGVARGIPFEYTYRALTLLFFGFRLR